MQRRDAADAGQPGEQRGVVTVADEDLRRLRRTQMVQQRQQLGAAVAAAQRD